MKKLFKWAIIGIAAFFVVMLIVVVSVDRRVYSSYIEQAIVKAARDAGVFLTLKETRVYPVGIHATEASVVVPTAFLFLTLQDVDVSSPILTLLRLAPAVSFKGHAYNSSVEGTAEYLGKDGDSKMSLAIDGLDLAQNQQLAGLGIASGIVDLHAPEITVTKGRASVPTFSVTVKNFSHPSTWVLPTATTGLIFDLPIPAVRNLELTSTGSLAPEKITVSTFDSRSSLGQVSGNAEFELTPSRRLHRIHLDLTAHFSSEGFEVVRPMLTLIPGRPKGPPSPDFRLIVDGIPPLPTYKYEPLGSASPSLGVPPPPNPS